MLIFDIEFTILFMIVIYATMTQFSRQAIVWSHTAFQVHFFRFCFFFVVEKMTIDLHFTSKRVFQFHLNHIGRMIHQVTLQKSIENCLLWMPFNLKFIRFILSSIIFCVFVYVSIDRVFIVRARALSRINKLCSIRTLYQTNTHFTHIIHFVHWFNTKIKLSALKFY